MLIMEIADLLNTNYITLVLSHTKLNQTFRYDALHPKQKTLGIGFNTLVLYGLSLHNYKK